MHTAESIKALIDKSDAACERAIVILYQRQTQDEQHSRTTSHKNGRGFGAFDADFGSSLAQQVMSGQRLTSRQLIHARRMAKKYVRQILEEAEAVEAARAAEYDKAERSAIQTV